LQWRQLGQAASHSLFQRLLEFINHAASQQRLEFPTSATTCRRGIRNAAPPALRRGNGLSLAIGRTYAPPRRHEAGNFP
jgi:hypothetical protein